MDENMNNELPIDISEARITPIKGFPWGSSSIGKIAGALAKAQGAMQNPAKTKRVNQKRWSKAANGYVDASYGYAPLSELQDVSRETLAANGIAVFQSVSMYDGRIGVTTVLLHESGEWLATELMSYAFGAEQPSIQDMGSIITYLKRYSYGGALNLSAADDDDDGQGDKPENHAPASTPPANSKKPTGQPPKQGKPAEKAPEKPANAAGDDVKEARAEFVKALASPEWKNAGMDLKALNPIADRLFKAGTISADNSDNYNADDFYIVMAHADLEIAKKRWLAGGIQPATWEEVAASLAEAQEVKTAEIDKMDDADVAKLMEAVDELAGSGK